MDYHKRDYVLLGGGRHLHGAIFQKEATKGIGRGHLQNYGKKIHMGNGCSEEGLRDRWTPGQPTLTTPQVIAMYITTIKVAGYTSGWEDPH
eukprot:10624078-Karenia_brevis.AAC.1